MACIANIPQPEICSLIRDAGQYAKNGTSTGITYSNPNILNRVMPNWDDKRTLKLIFEHCGIVTLENQAGLAGKHVDNFVE